EFLNNFNSHISDGVHHLGGIYLRTISASTNTSSSIDELEKITTKCFNASLDVGFSKFNVGSSGALSYESFNDCGTHTANKIEKKQATIECRILSFGPPCTNPDIFAQLLSTNNSFWHLIDRSDFRSFLPVWELMNNHSDNYIQQAARKIKQAWLQQAANFSHIPIIQCEIDRVMLDTRNPTALSIRLPSHRLMSVKDSISFDTAVDTVEDILKSEIGSFDTDAANETQLLNKTISAFHIIFEANSAFGHNLLPALLTRETLKRFLTSIGLCDQVLKLQLTYSIITRIFNEQLLNQLQRENISLGDVTTKLLNQAK
ncbi:unnamed protein product, partial [Didymodactylos carnosus]